MSGKRNATGCSCVLYVALHSVIVLQRCVCVCVRVCIMLLCSYALKLTRSHRLLSASVSVSPLSWHSALHCPTLHETQELTQIIPMAFSLHITGVRAPRLCGTPLGTPWSTLRASKAGAEERALPLRHRVWPRGCGDLKTMKTLHEVHESCDFPGCTAG